MKNTRPALAAAIAMSAVLLFAGCASGGSGDSTTGAKDCSALNSEIRDINNGAQNTLAGDLSEGQADAKAYFDKLGDRVDALEDTWESDAAVKSALETLADKLDAAEDYIDTVPTDGSDPDAAAQETVTGDIQTAASDVNAACSAK